MEKKRFMILLLRGLLGGALGGFVLIGVLVNPVTFGSSWYFWLFAGFAFFGLPCGLIIGGILGITIWLIHHTTGASLGPFVRAIIGALIAMTLWNFFFLLKDASEYTASSWRWQLGAVFLFGAATGGVTGLIVGSPARTALPKDNPIDRVGDMNR